MGGQAPLRAMILASPGDVIALAVPGSGRRGTRARESSDEASKADGHSAWNTKKELPDRQASCPALLPMPLATMPPVLGAVRTGFERETPQVHRKPSSAGPT